MRCFGLFLWRSKCNQNLIITAKITVVKIPTHLAITTRSRRMKTGIEMSAEKKKINQGTKRKEGFEFTVGLFFFRNPFVIKHLTANDYGFCPCVILSSDNHLLSCISSNQYGCSSWCLYFYIKTISQSSWFCWWSSH